MFQPNLPILILLSPDSKDVEKLPSMHAKDQDTSSKSAAPAAASLSSIPHPRTPLQASQPHQQRLVTPHSAVHSQESHPPQSESTPQSATSEYSSGLRPFPSGQQTGLNLQKRSSVQWMSQPGLIIILAETRGRGSACSSLAGRGDASAALGSRARVACGMRVGGKVQILRVPSSPRLSTGSAVRVGGRVQILRVPSPP
ncbi:hypothetical protein KC341_g76 [Hortaea werneckii]|nr:hypothetical protein KC341_g76 [Hortaea werneckii]